MLCTVSPAEVYLMRQALELLDALGKLDESLHSAGVASLQVLNAPISSFSEGIQPIPPTLIHQADVFCTEQILCG